MQSLETERFHQEQELRPDYSQVRNHSLKQYLENFEEVLVRMRRVENKSAWLIRPYWITGSFKTERISGLNPANILSNIVYKPPKNFIITPIIERKKNSHSYYYGKNQVRAFAALFWEFERFGYFRNKPTKEEIRQIITNVREDLGGCFLKEYINDLPEEDLNGKKKSQNISAFSIIKESLGENGNDKNPKGPFQKTEYSKNSPKKEVEPGTFLKIPDLEEDELEKLKKYPVRRLQIINALIPNDMDNFSTQRHKVKPYVEKVVMFVLAINQAALEHKNPNEYMGFIEDHTTSEFKEGLRICIGYLSTYPSRKNLYGLFETLKMVAKSSEPNSNGSRPA